ncbi:hypothetical protein ABZ806_41085 [Spirillospora sp. NPDC047418]
MKTKKNAGRRSGMLVGAAVALSAAGIMAALPASAAAPIHYSFDLTGSSFIKAPNGTADLTGGVEADLDVTKPTDNVVADLTLNPTTGHFQILGFLPVDAAISFVPVGKTTGTYANSALTTHSKMTVKLSSFKAFGALELGGGENCQTSEPSDITLASEGKFIPSQGGTLKTSDYALSSIQDCGALTGILNLFTAGSGNTIDLKLAPKA